MIGNKYLVKIGEKRSHSPGKDNTLTVVLPEWVLEKARDAVYWTPGLTLASLVSESLIAEVDRRERFRGHKFPPRETKKLKTGRPIR